MTASAVRRRYRGSRFRPRMLLHRGDPTNTSGIIRQYIADLRRRWAEIARLIQETLVVNDALHIMGPNPFELAAAQAATAFEFRQDVEGKIEDFNAWLRGELDSGVLEIRRAAPGTPALNPKWQDRYVRAAYSRGLRHAGRALDEAGIPFDSRTVEDLFNAPLHRDSLAMLYTRQFAELEGISAATGQQISRVLTEGLATGQGPRQIARNMRQVIANIGVVRSQTLARTETIRVHAESSLNRYVDAGVDEVTVFAEFVTAGDDRVCPDCLALETGEAVSIEDARGVIPVHANCRCAWLPVLPD